MTKPAPDPAPQFKIECPCGWNQTFSRGYSGLEIECQRCGRTHRIPMVGMADAEADNEAKAVMEKLISTQPYGHENPVPAEQTVRLKPLFLLSAVVCALAVVAALVFFHAKPWPMAVVIIGGAASWPLGLWVAWLGQRRQRKLAQQSHARPTES